MSRKLKHKEIKPKGVGDALNDFITKIKENPDFVEYFNYISDREKSINEFIKPGKSIIAGECKLTVLRRFNSYTPILPSRNTPDVIKGGGYFLQAYETGIVIDPGFNFCENFLNAGFKLDDIDYIFISHAHNDHTVELESLFSLFYKRNMENDSKRKIKLFMNLGSFKKFSGYFNLIQDNENNYIDDIVILNRHQLIYINQNVRLFTTQAKHFELITKNYSLGFVFYISNYEDDGETEKIIKFTADTGWDSDNEERNINEADQLGLQTQAHILVAHLGSIKKKEMEYDTAKDINDNKETFYSNHLGMLGVCAMIDKYKPEVILLSEFGEETDAIRIELAKVFSGLLNKRVFAADINFVFDIKNMQIRSHFTGAFISPEVADQRCHDSIVYTAETSTLSSTSVKNDIGNYIRSKGISVFNTTK